jgi:hypothetical protein
MKFGTHTKQETRINNLGNNPNQKQKWVTFNCFGKENYYTTNFFKHSTLHIAYRPRNYIRHQKNYKTNQ